MKWSDDWVFDFPQESVWAGHTNKISCPNLECNA